MRHVPVEGGIFFDQRTPCQLRRREYSSFLQASLRQKLADPSPRVVIVNGSPEQISQVTSRCGEACFCRGRNPGKLGYGLSRKFGEKSSHKHGAPGDVLQDDAV